LAKVFEILMRHRLNRRQLEMLSRLKESEGMLYYRIVEKFSEEYEIPESTVRWNLNRLRDAELIISGNKKHRGIPVELTPPGRIITSLFESLYAEATTEETKSWTRKPWR